MTAHDRHFSHLVSRPGLLGLHVPQCTPGNNDVRWSSHRRHTSLAPPIATNPSDETETSS